MAHQPTIDFLHSLAELVKSEQPLDNILALALRKLCRELSFLRSAITLINPRNGAIKIEASYGLNPEQAQLGA